MRNIAFKIPSLPSHVRNLFHSTPHRCLSQNTEAIPHFSCSKYLEFTHISGGSAPQKCPGPLLSPNCPVCHNSSQWFGTAVTKETQETRRLLGKLLHVRYLIKRTGEGRGGGRKEGEWKRRMGVILLKYMFLCLYVCLFFSQGCLLTKAQCRASEYNLFSLICLTGLQSEFLIRLLNCRVHQLWGHSALWPPNGGLRVPGSVSATQPRAHPCSWRPMIDTPLVSFPELPSICTINPFQLSDLSCWFLCLKTGTRMKSPLEDKAANTCEGRMVARVSLRLKTNGHLCIRRYINCWNWTNERDVISFWELKKPSWSPNEGWIGLSLATWLRTDMGAGLRGNTEEMNKLEGRWVQDALGPVYSKALSIAGFSKPLKKQASYIQVDISPLPLLQFANLLPSSAFCPFSERDHQFAPRSTLTFVSLDIQYGWTTSPRSSQGHC